MSFEIEHRDRLSYQDFVQDYLFPHKPVVIVDALSQWPALAKWSPEFFKRQFGEMKFSMDEGKKGVTEWTMSAFVDRVMGSEEGNPAPYFRNRVFQEVFPSLIPDIQPLPEYLFPNWMSEKYLIGNVQRSLNRGGQMEFYMGGRGGSFPYLHYDGMATHAFLLQIHGLKQFILYSPDQESLLYPNPDRPNQTLVGDLDSPDLTRFPKFANAKPIRFVLEPGQMLFIPYRWWHTTQMLTPSISLSVNMLNESNWSGVVDWVATRKPSMSIPIRAYLKMAGGWRARRDRRQGLYR